MFGYDFGLAVLIRACVCLHVFIWPYVFFYDGTCVDLLKTIPQSRFVDDGV